MILQRVKVFSDRKENEMRKSIKFKKVVTVLTIMSLIVSTVAPVMAKSATKTIGGKSFTGVSNRDTSKTSYYYMNDKLYGETKAQILKIEGGWKKSNGNSESGVNTGNKVNTSSITATDSKGPTGMYTKYTYNGTVKYNNKTDTISFSVSF